MSQQVIRVTAVSGQRGSPAGSAPRLQPEILGQNPGAALCCSRAPRGHFSRPHPHHRTPHTYFRLLKKVIFTQSTNCFLAPMHAEHRIPSYSTALSSSYNHHMDSFNISLSPLLFLEDPIISLDAKAIDHFSLPL